KVNWTEFSAGIIASPNFYGVIEDLTDFSEKVHSSSALAISAVNPISLGILKSPGQCGIDLVIGNGQVLGNKISFGGPTFGFFASTEALLRNLPGRLIGKTTDKEGRESFVMTLQTREQHIRRENATSNICSNQALNALAGTVYLSVLGKNGMRSVSRHNLSKAHYLMDNLQKEAGVKLEHKKEFIFNEFVFTVEMDGDEFLKRLKEKGIIGGIHLKRFSPEFKNRILCAVTELKTKSDLDNYVTEAKRILKSK
ncbi:MAG: glycine dehydrogenase, partial [bacterium]|nr:glycine dehydrogenase [bacterium]